MKRLALLAFFLVTACGSFGAAQAHSITLAYKTGDTYTYKLHAVLKYTMAASGMSFPINLDASAKEAMTVKSVDSSGAADLSVAVSDVTLKMTMNGATNTSTTNTTSTLDMKIARDGHIVSINGSAFAQNSLPGMYGTQGGLVTSILPDKPVRAGDKWSKSFDMPNPLGTGSSQVTSDNTYLRDENNAAVIESKIKGNVDLTIDTSSMTGSAGMPMVPSTGGASSVEGVSVKGTSTTDVTSWIDTSAHRVVKTRSTGIVNAELTVNMAPGSTTPGLTGPITIKGTQTLDLNPA